ncbi:MAG: hypothetical protein ACK4NF_03195, partial [Planctomycetota bacterium]
MFEEEDSESYIKVMLPWMRGAPPPMVQNITLSFGHISTLSCEEGEKWSEFKEMINENIYQIKKFLNGL